MAETRKSGQIIKRDDNVWLVRIFLGRDAKGKRRYVNKTIRGTKKDAQKYLNAVLRDKDLGVFVEPSSESLEAYLDKWLSTAAKPRLSESTYNHYKFVLNRYIQPSLGTFKLTDIKLLDVQKVYTQLQSNGLSPRTVRYAHTVLSSAFKQAVIWKMLAINPCVDAVLPKSTRNEMKAFSPEQAQKFLQAAKDNKYGLILVFALVTGMRPEEYLGLKWSDLDLIKKTATVQRSLLWRKGGGWYFYETKRSRSRRTIPFSESLASNLKHHKRQQLEQRLKLGAAYQNNDLVFPTSVGTPLNLRNLFHRGFKKVVERAGLQEGFRLYDLRHSCATLLLSANENPKIVSERLGHASIVLTLDVYSHVLPNMQQAATDKLEDLLYKKTGSQ
jgi:integrase